MLERLSVIPMKQTASEKIRYALNGYLGYLFYPAIPLGIGLLFIPEMWLANMMMLLIAMGILIYDFLYSRNRVHDILSVVVEPVENQISQIRAYSEKGLERDDLENRRFGCEARIRELQEFKRQLAEKEEDDSGYADEEIRKVGNELSMLETVKKIEDNVLKRVRPR